MRTISPHLGKPPKRMRHHLGDDDVFALTCGMADIDLAAEIASQKARGRRATIAVIRPPKRFGAVALEGQRVLSFREKPEGGWIN